MRKTAFVWIIMVLFCLSVLSELLSSIGLSVAGLSSYYGSHNALNAIALVSLILDIIIGGVFIYKLFIFKKDVIYWTDIVFGYSVLRLIFAIIADSISAK